MVFDSNKHPLGGVYCGALLTNQEVMIQTAKLSSVFWWLNLVR